MCVCSPLRSSAVSTFGGGTAASATFILIAAGVVYGTEVSFVECFVNVNLNKSMNECFCSLLHSYTSIVLDV